MRQHAEAAMHWSAVDWLEDCLDHYGLVGGTVTLGSRILETLQKIVIDGNSLHILVAAVL